MRSQNPLFEVSSQASAPAPSRNGVRAASTKPAADVPTDLTIMTTASPFNGYCLIYLGHFLIDAFGYGKIIYEAFTQGGAILWTD